MATTLGCEVHVSPSFKVYGGSSVPRQRRTYRRAAAVVTITVHPEVWAIALETAEGDTSRIEVVNATTVVVFNSPAARRRAGNRRQEP